jgi:hypothetical protein
MVFTVLMGFINILEHLRVVILQDAAEMLIAGRTHYLFLHEVFSCQLFKEFVKVMTMYGTFLELISWNAPNNQLYVTFLELIS